MDILDVARYLATNYEQLGGKLLQNYPPYIKIYVQNLPHNEILNDEFWNEYGSHTTLLIYEGQDENGKWGQWELE